MKHFIKRYFGWYLWLSIYTTAIGGLIGLACFSLSPFFPIFVMFFFVLYPAALALAAPLNLLVLPPAFHLLRDHPWRQTWLHLIGMAGGLLSPTLAAPAWCMLFEPRFPLRGLCGLDPLGPSFEPTLSVAFAVVGLIAGFCCAGLFNKHGDRASIFDVNAALDALRQQEPR
jgi:hypothetical protein